MTPNVFRWTDIAAARGIRIAAILLIALILNRILRSLTRRMIPSGAAEGLGRIARMREQHVKTLAGLLYSAGTAILVVGAILTALPEFGFNVTPIAAAAGLASLAIGFGAQHLVRDLINGFFIIIEDQFVVGEMVRIGTTVGRVEYLTLRRTVVRDTQGAVVTIPNGEVSQVANLSRDWGQVFVDVCIPAESSSDAALAALERVCSELRADVSWSPVLVDGPRALGVESLGAAGATLRLQLRTVPGRQDDAARELRRRIQNRFEQEHIRWGGVQRVEVTGNETPHSLAARSNS
ncbi:MAG TPA: mechanosensitive ion channel family protein [Candidatus Acidoferrales bacterium]|jgi:small conductance mechanosensitive channel|nr:mechanosensitive ion channel family protein [Candidatus Acidoferrales bacterium]